MEIEYLSDAGFRINSAFINWDDDRLFIRSIFKGIHKEDDKIFEFEDENIEQRRDVYQNYLGEDNCFFLNYNSNDQFSEIEIHWGMSIIIKGVRLVFENELSDVIKSINALGFDAIEMGKGEFFFPELRMTIADGEAMGGNGNGLSYFYATKDVSHLSEYM